MKPKYEITVIVFCSETKKNIKKTLDSLYCQTFKKFDILIIDESLNNEVEKDINSNLLKENNIKYLKKTNKSDLKEYLLKKITGKYTFIMEASDTIENRTLDLCLEKMQESKYDFLFIEWKKSFKNSNKQIYDFVNKEIGIKDYLTGEDRLLLLKNLPYNVKNKFYRTDFFKKQKIDLKKELMYINFCLSAKSIGLIHSPLYTNEIVSDKNINEEEIVLNFLEISLEILFCDLDFELASKHAFNYIYKEFKRIYQNIKNDENREKLLREYVLLLSKVEKNNNNFFNLSLKKLFKENMSNNEKYLQIKRISKRKINLLKILKKTYRRLKKTIIHSLIKIIYIIFPLRKKNVLLVGYQFKYTGNLKYLHQQIFQKYPQNNYIYIVNKYEASLPRKNQVIYKSIKYFYYFLITKTVIFETYFYTSLPKNKKQIWILIWHGTTVKKLLFDYSTRYTILKNPKHKIKKFNFVSNLQYLITDNENINKYFETSFLLKPNQILPYGYPRVKYLIDNKNNKILKEKIKNHLGIINDKKTILYVPTWRDYNYIKKDTDFSYLLNLEKVQKLSKNEYNIIFKNHPHMNNYKFKNSNIINDCSTDTQDLLLISDYVISDYSSIVFDAMAIDKKILIYANDMEKYEDCHGVYRNVMQDLLNWKFENEEKLISMLNSYKKNKKYFEMKEKYCFKNSEYKVLEFINNYTKK